MYLEPEKQYLYNSLLYSAEDLEILAELLYSQKLYAFNSTLQGLVEEFEEEAEFPSDSEEIRLQAEDEAGQIATTFSKDLYAFLAGLEEYYDLEAEVRLWNASRSAYKNPMIALHNLIEWGAKAIVVYFLLKPHLEAYAELVPKTPVVCETCMQYVNLGRVPVKQVLEVMQSWPPHLNCIHTWKIVRSV